MPQQLRCLFASHADTAPTRRLASWLSRQGHMLSHAHCLDAAVIQLARQPFDLVVLDAGFGDEALLRALPILRGATSNRAAQIYLFRTEPGEPNRELQCDGALHACQTEPALRAQLSRTARLTALLDSLRQQQDEGFVAALRADPDGDLAAELFALLSRLGAQRIAEVKSESLPGDALAGPFTLVRPLADGRVRLLLADHRQGVDRDIAACLAAQTLLTAGAGVTLTGLALRLHQRLRTALGDGALLKASFAEISSDGCQAELLNAGMGAVLRVGEISDDIESIDVGNAPLGGGHDGLRETRAVSIALRPQDRLLLCASPSELAEDAEIEALSVARLRRRIVRNRHRANLLDELLTDINLHCPELAGRAVLEWRNRQKPVVSDSPYPQASAAATAWTYRLDLSVGMLCHFDPLPLLLDAAAQAPGLIERAARFRRLTQELLENALEHGLRGRPNGHLRVELRYREDAIGYRRLTLAIEDSGPGFNHEAWFALEKVEAGLRGRGIAIARELSEWLRYRGRGNLVEASFRWPVSCDLNVSLPYDPPATTFHRRL